MKRSPLLSCLITKITNQPERALLTPIESNYPFEMISMDYLHLDRSNGGFEYALIKNKSAILAAEKLFNEFILHFGFPKRIHHDQGREFDNKLFKHLYQLSGISNLAQPHIRWVMDKSNG